MLMIFCLEVLQSLLNSFAEGTFCSKAFNYLGLNLKQNEKDIHFGLQDYIEKMERSNIGKCHKIDKKQKTELNKCKQKPRLLVD